MSKMKEALAIIKHYADGEHIKYVSRDLSDEAYYFETHNLMQEGYTFHCINEDNIETWVDSGERAANFLGSL